ncbi:hypothetical protein BDV37DRAFT_276720 [Aspergillus pseudonomiae]|uniref:Uncharacterized protein n=1 Tax=Aspergillus pseudonomiae TaxID=1506151 RepID=A0A5N7CUS2_9EURO|nr:uncharacterized protein BDV37DRAFT_276720 [Aspergillus pseudonomiae]KAE8397709.1 hypothetical protein BDV37DRAFT_276720 [Aspergillus pseudonomiae]
MTQPAPRRALVDLDNIEFYRPQSLKSPRSESALLIPPILPPLSILPGGTARKTLPRGDGALPFDHPYGLDSSCSPASLNTFDVDLARCANAASLATGSHTVNEFTQGQTGNETFDASSFSLASSPSLSSLPKTTDLPGPFGNTTSREGIRVSTEPDSHLCFPSPDLQERDQPRDIQPCGSHDEPSVSHGRCSNIPHHDNHSISMCGIPPSPHIAQNDVANKPLGEQENDRVALGDGPLQLKQNISMPALSQGDPLLNDQRLPSIGVVDSGPEYQHHSDSGKPPSTITKPPQRKSFELAQARMVGGRNRPRRNCQPGFDVVQRDRHPDYSDQEESPRLTKRRKRATRHVGTLTSRTSSGPSGKLLRSSASAQSAKSYGSQDNFRHAILTPNSSNELGAPQFRFALDEPRHLTAPSSTSGSKNKRYPHTSDIHPHRRARMGSGANLGVTDLDGKAAISGSVERV